MQPLLQWKNNEYYTTCLSVCSLRYPACNERAPYCHLWPAPLYSIFPYYVINGRIFGKNVTEYKMCVLISSTTFVWNIYHSRKNWVRYKEYTGCNRRNGPDFGRVFLRSNYTDITQNPYIQSWTVTEILTREKRGLLWCLRTVLVSVTSFSPLLELHSYVRANVAPAT